MTELKRIDFESGQFTANGKLYLIENSMSIGRYIKFEEMEVEAGFGRSLIEIFEQLQAAYNDLNGNPIKTMDAGVKLYNLLSGAADFKRKKPYVLRYCALFINEENENRAVLTEEMINKKVADWVAEGIHYEDFFTFTVTSLPGYSDIYKKLTQVISQNKTSQ